jgi:hypothetical protein
MARKPETILCAAYHIDDGVPRAHQPVKTGYIFAGHRHHNIIAASDAAGVFRCLVRNQDSGFLTSTGRFVGREEGWEIAEAQGQIHDRSTGPSPTPGTLYSEDLY